MPTLAVRMELCPARVKFKLQALGIWACLSLPSILVTLVLYFCPEESDDDKESNRASASDDVSSSNASYTCYENLTVYHPIYLEVKFWIEGVLLLIVGSLGFLGNLLTLAVLARSKNSNFNRLLIFLSVADIFLIVFFLLMSSSTVLSDPPQWFVVLFPYVLWPLGNMAITASVLAVVAVSTERFLAIVRPLQYKPGPAFYVLLVLMLATSVNTGRFLEYSLEWDAGDSNSTPRYYNTLTPLMSDTRYIVFSRYWTDLICIGIFPLLSLILLNYGIYTKIRKSTRFRKQHDNTAVAAKYTAAAAASGAAAGGSDFGVSTNSNRSACFENPRYVAASPNSNSASRVSNVRFVNKTSSNNADAMMSVSAAATRQESLGVPDSAPGRNSFARLSNQSSPRHADCRQQGRPSYSSASSQISGPSSHTTSSATSANERSMKPLVGIVVVFLICHLFRLVVHLDAAIHPGGLEEEHQAYCAQLNRSSSPIFVWFLTSVNNFFLVLNSSINFVIYCLAGRTFRATLIRLFTRRGSGQPVITTEVFTASRHGGATPAQLRKVGSYNDVMELAHGNGTRVRRMECGEDDVEEAIARMAMDEFAKQQRGSSAAANVRSNL